MCNCFNHGLRQILSDGGTLANIFIKWEFVVSFICIGLKFFGNPASRSCMVSVLQSQLPRISIKCTYTGLTLSMIRKILFKMIQSVLYFILLKMAFFFILIVCCMLKVTVFVNSPLHNYLSNNNVSILKCYCLVCLAMVSRFLMLIL